MQKILVIGSSNVDRVIRMEQMPAVGETVYGKDIRTSTGGKGANQAYACGKLGGTVMFLSVLGKDEGGYSILENMEQAGVNVSAVSFSTTRNTGMASIYVDARGSNSIVVLSGANEECNISFIRSHRYLIAQADILLIQLEIPLDGAYAAIEIAASLGKTVVLNPAPAPETITAEIYRCVDYVTPNEAELARLTGMPVDSLEQICAASRKLLAFGPKHVIVTLGSQGAILSTSEESTLFPPPEVTVTDTTAAGDTFNAAFVTELARGCGVPEAIRFANFAAAIAVSRPGAQASVPGRDEVLEFLSMKEAAKSRMMSFRKDIV